MMMMIKNKSETNVCELWIAFICVAWQFKAISSLINPNRWFETTSSWACILVEKKYLYWYDMAN